MRVKPGWPGHTVSNHLQGMPSGSKSFKSTSLYYVLLTWFSSVFLSCASIDVLSEYIAHLPNPTFMAQGVCWRNALPWLPWHDVTWRSFLGPPGVTRPDLSGLRNRAVQWFSPCYPPMWLLEEHRRKSFARQATRFKARMNLSLSFSVRSFPTEVFSTILISVFFS